jgi:hypothetical protein
MARPGSRQSFDAWSGNSLLSDAGKSLQMPSGLNAISGPTAGSGSSV